MKKESQPPLPVEEYLDALLSLPGMYRPQISRNGQWACWTWARMGPAADVFAAPTDGSQQPFRLSETSENTYLVSWLPDNSGVIVAQDQGGDERYQLSRITLDNPLVMDALTEAEPDYFLRGGELHPNGRWLVYGANYDFDVSQEIEPTWIYRHDLGIGEKKVLARPEKGGYIEPSLSTDGAFVLYSRKDLHPAGRQVWLVDIEGREDRELLNFGEDVKTFASWFPGEHRILVLSETETHRRLGVMGLSDQDPTWLVDDPGRKIEQAYVPYGAEQVVILEVRDARLQASLLHPDTGKESELTTTEGNLIPLAPGASGSWLGQFYSSTQPGDISRFAPRQPRYDPAGTVSRVWEQTSLAAEDFTPAESIHWNSTDGLQIQGWMYLPEGQPKGTVVYVHGGPTYHSQDAINNQIQLFVHNGFAVLDPNYRGSTGFGVEFREAIKEEGWGGKEVEDIRSGIAYLQGQGVAASGKVGITGTSYGGYLSWCAITRFPRETLAAAAPVCGMTDLMVDYESTRPDLRPYSEEMLGGSPEEIPEKYYQRSPIHFVSEIEGEVLIVQGERDPNVTPENVRVVREALEEAGVDYQVLAFEDEGHGISKPKNQKVLYARLLAFFERALV